MDIDNEHLGIPDQEHSAVVTMSSGDFQVACFLVDFANYSVLLKADLLVFWIF